MMSIYFLFLESLGTPEVILIMVVILVVFGPRKLPTIGRTIGKYTAEFKRASSEFRTTFEREINMAELEEKEKSGAAATTAAVKDSSLDFFGGVENTIGRGSARRTATGEESFESLNENSSIAMPEIRAVSQTEFKTQTAAPEPAPVETANSKRDWL